MSSVNPLSAEFLYELYATALCQEQLCAVLSRHMRKEYLPDRSFQRVQEAIAAHFRTYKTPPSYAVLAQTFHEDYDAIELIDTFREYDEGQSSEVMIDMLESYIKGVRLQSVYAEVGKLYNENKQDKAEKALRGYAEWLAGFTLKSTSFIDVAETFTERFQRNRRREEEEERLFGRAGFQERLLLRTGKDLGYGDAPSGKAGGIVCRQHHGTQLSAFQRPGIDT